MALHNKKIIAAKLMKIGVNRVWLDANRLEEINKALTRKDIGNLIKDRAIQKKPEKGISRFRIRKRLLKKRKGRRRKSFKGTKNARFSNKKEWINKIRAIRKLLYDLRKKNSISNDSYKHAYKKAKGGFFRSRRHVLLYLEEHGLLHNTKASNIELKQK